MATFARWMIQLMMMTYMPNMLMVTIAPLSRMDSDHFEDPTTRLSRWAEATVNYVHNLNCRDVFLTTERECRELVQVAQDQMNIYVADPSVRGRLAAVLPDGALSRSGAHDAVLVLDPYPRASFGHLTVVFFLDKIWSEAQCELNGGHYIGHGDCLLLALKNRCHNLLERRSRRRNLARRCEINFLPLIHLADQPPRGQEDQLLRCRDSIPGFAPCPSFRPVNETRQLLCNPLHVNTQRCSTTHETVHTRCRVFEICDRAVLLAGGWNRLTSDRGSMTNLRSMYQMLRSIGFRKRNIKIFFANGAENFEVLGGENHPLYPSVFKLALRYHLKKMCESPNCVDSLVLYLNSPTENDGTSLLWDIDGNGQADEDEIYTVEEMMADLQDCSARQVFVIADQSFSGQLVKSFNRSTRHSNVHIFTSSREREYSWQGELTRLWVSFRHQHACVDQVYEASQRAVRQSNPMMFSGSSGSNRKTLFGAPCDVVSPFTNRELHQNYYGCQNLPANIWVNQLMQ